MRDALIGVATDRASADILEKRASATKKLLKQIEKFDEVVMRLADVLIVKVTMDGRTRLLIETIYHKLAQQLADDPLLMQRPRKLFSILSKSAARLPSPDEARRDRVDTDVPAVRNDDNETN